MYISFLISIIYIILYYILNCRSLYNVSYRFIAVYISTFRKGVILPQFTYIQFYLVYKYYRHRQQLQASSAHTKLWATFYNVIYFIITLLYISIDESKGLYLLSEVTALIAVLILKLCYRTKRAITYYCLLYYTYIYILFCLSIRGFLCGLTLKFSLRIEIFNGPPSSK